MDKNSVAVITGAASGIGRALAKEAAAKGMSLWLADVNKEPLEVLKDELTQQGTIVHTRIVDVSNPEAVESFAQDIFADGKGVDLLFNNAGVLTIGFLGEQDLKDWDWIMGVNLMGPVHGVRSFLPRMEKQGRPARIINTGSLSGLIPTGTSGIYSVSKHGVMAFSEALYHDLSMRKSTVSVSVIAPGGVATNIADAEENRPSELKTNGDPDPGQIKIQQMVKAGLAQMGMDPDDLAQHVFSQIEKGSFWILPHDDFGPALEERTRRIIAQGVPAFPDLNSIPDVR